MVVSTSQPYFAPFPGFFTKALCSDVLVLMDTVQFPRGTTWLHRNRFKNDQGTLWMTIPVWKKGLGLQSIHEVNICHEGRWARKHLASLKTAYWHAPYLEDHLPFLEQIFGQEYGRLVDLNLQILRYLMKELRVETPVRLLSELSMRSQEPSLSLDVARRLEAREFLAGPGAAKVLDAAAFEREGIQLGFYRPSPVIYPQLWGPFLPNLSALDLLLNCGPRAGEILRKAIPGHP